MVLVTDCTELSDKWFNKLISEGKLPKPIKLSRSSRWKGSEVRSWLEEKIELSRATELWTFDEENYRSF